MFSILKKENPWLWSHIYMTYDLIILISILNLNSYVFLCIIFESQSLNLIFVWLNWYHIIYKYCWFLLCFILFDTQCFTLMDLFWIHFSFMILILYVTYLSLVKYTWIHWKLKTLLTWTHKDMPLSCHHWQAMWCLIWVHCTHNVSVIFLKRTVRRHPIACLWVQDI